MKPTESLAPPSMLGNSTLFANINMAIADPDLKIAQLVKDILSSLGCNRIYVAQDGQELIELMVDTQIDIIVTDWDMRRMTGLDLVTYMRQSLNSPNRMIPYIMLTARNDRTDIEIARDAGVSEYIVKPFSAKTLLERVHAVVEDPRSFILCKSYVGPDRRRPSSLSLPPDPDADHPFIERTPPAIVPQEILRQLILDDTPRMIMPDYSLKKKIGFDIPPELIANPLMLAQSEDEIENVQAEFLQFMIKDVHQLEAAYQLLVSNPEHISRLAETIKELTFSIKARAGIFGYIRATEVAGQLYNFIRRHWDRDNRNHLIILEKHIQTISVIFQQRITGDGGEIGRELLKDLARLINKYHSKKD